MREQKESAQKLVGLIKETTAEDVRKLATDLMLEQKESAQKLVELIKETTAESESMRKLAILEQKVEHEWLNSFIRQQVAYRRNSLWARLGNKFSSDRKVVADSGLFDANWYWRNYLDVAEARATPLDHYLSSGASEGRDPNPFFSTTAYLKFNPDVAGSGMNPLVHFVRYGAAEGRRFSE
jgi:uncharacterized protein YegP (UPF0339 family)